MTVEQMLATHREVWDMPTLAEKHPEILKHLDAKYEVHFGMFSDVIVYHRATRTPEGFETTDVRVAVETLLEREVAALIREQHEEASDGT